MASQQSLPGAGLQERHPGRKCAARHRHQHAVVQLPTTGSTALTVRATARSSPRAFQVAGLFGNVRYISPVLEFKQFRAIKGLRLNPDGRNVIGYKLQLAYVQGISGAVAPPFNRFYTGGENDLRGFDVRSGTPYAFIPDASALQPHQP